MEQPSARATQPLDDATKPLRRFIRRDWLTWLLLIGGSASGLLGLLVGAPQLVITHSRWAANARHVTLDNVYLVIFFWSFWFATSVG